MHFTWLRRARRVPDIPGLVAELHAIRLARIDVAKMLGSYDARTAGAINFRATKCPRWFCHPYTQHIGYPGL